MKPIKHEVWDLDNLTFEYAEKFNINPREFGDTFIKKYVPIMNDCDNVYNLNYVDVCFDTNDKLDKSIVDFMGLEVPLGNNFICVTFRL